jgi:NADPH:quinone reductase-like Zn-dependent oxidoreductase
MKAIIKDRYGGPEVLHIGEVDRPDVGPEQVLVRVHASAANAHDWHMLRGKPYLARLSEGFRRPKERELGLDVAGVVEAVGTEVTDLAPGDRVFGSRYGAYAEYVSGKNFVPMPAGLSFEQAAAIPVAGLTALQGLRDKGGLVAGKRVLVNGAGGGVGTMAVQIAKALGAEVTAVTTERGAEVMRSIGADRVIDRARVDFTRGTARYDLVLDCGGRQSLRALRRVLTPNGRIVMVAPQPGQWIGPVARVVGAVVTSKFSERKAIAYLSQVNRDDLRTLAELVEAGRLTPVIDRTYTFEQIPEAIGYLESGQARGKVVIRYIPSEGGAS